MPFIDQYGRVKQVQKDISVGDVARDLSPYFNSTLALGSRVAREMTGDSELESEFPLIEGISQDTPWYLPGREPESVDVQQDVRDYVASLGFSEDEQQWIYGGVTRSGMIQRIRTMQADKKFEETMSRASAGQVIAGIMPALIADPVNLFGGKLATLVRQPKKGLALINKLLKTQTARGAAVGGALGGAEELAIMANEGNVSPAEAAGRVLLTATLGAGIGRWLETREMVRAAQKKIADDVLDGHPSRIHAPDAAPGILRVGEIFSPALRLADSPFRIVASRASSVFRKNFYQMGNRLGIASSPSWEDEIIDSWSFFNDFMDAADQAFNRFSGVADAKHPHLQRKWTNLKSMTAGHGPRFGKFMEEVGEYVAGVNKRFHPEVVALGDQLSDIYKSWEKRLLDANKKFAGRADEALNPTYLRRRYNIHAILQNPEAFTRFVVDQFKRSKGDSWTPDQITEMVKSVDHTLQNWAMDPTERRILSKFYGARDERGSMLAREWDFIRDEDLYATNFVLKEAHGNLSDYTRQMMTDILMLERFGTLDIDEVIESTRKMELEKFNLTPRSKAEIAKFEAELEPALEDLKIGMERVRGTYNDPFSPAPGGIASRVIRSLKKFNNLRAGGKFTLTAFADVGRPAAAYGIKKTFGPQLRRLFNPETRAALQKGNRYMKAWGVGNEIHSSMRIEALTNDEHMFGATSWFENMLGKANNEFFFMNGLTPWNVYMKRQSGIVAMDWILEQAVKGDRNITDKARRRLAQIGVDSANLGEIARIFKEHGETIDGVRLIDYKSFQEAGSVGAEIGRKLRLGIQKEVDHLIMTPATGDVPHWFENQYVSLIGQYKSFAIAMTNHMLVKGVSEADARYIAGMMVSVVAGMGAAQYNANLQERELGWDELLIEGIGKSGWFGALGEANSYLAHSPFSGAAFTYSSQPDGLNSFVFGPTGSAVTDLTSILANNFDESTKGAQARMTPYLSLIQALNLLDGLSVEQEDSL